MIGLPSYRLVAAAFAVGAAIGIAGGWKVKAWQEDAARFAAARVAAEQMRQEQDRGNRIAEGWAAGFEVIRQQNRDREAALRRELEKAEYRCRVPDAGVGLLDDAVDAANTARQPGATVPGTPQASRSDPGRPDRP